jgi:hypothetical protein
MFSGPLEKNSNPSLHNPCKRQAAIRIYIMLTNPAPVAAFSVIVKTDGSFAALQKTEHVVKVGGRHGAGPSAGVRR